MGVRPLAVTLWQDVGGWIVIVAIFGWFAWYFALPSFVATNSGI